MARIPNRTGQPSTSTRETERWQRQIQNNLPLVGGWLRVEAARLLDQAARQGSGQATLVLALAYASSPDQRVRDLALDSLESIHKQTCMDAVWLAWIETRSTKLLQFLLDKNWIANAPPKARVYSALRLGKPDLLVRGQINYVAPLIEACRDAYPDLANQARECLRNLHEPEAIDVFCETWARDRSPELEDILIEAGYLANEPPKLRVLTALAGSRADILQHSSAAMVPALIQACHDPNPQFAHRAMDSISCLRDPQAIDAICTSWSENRASWLGDIILKQRYIAEAPPAARVLSALKTANVPILEQLAPEGIPTLVEACQDSDPQMRKNALPALQQLKRTDAQEAVCTYAIEKDHPLARRVALEQGYTPRSAEMRALFYFLTDQWEAYETLDFDRSLLRAVYETAPADLRRKVVRKVQQAGRTEFLTVLAGDDFRSRAGQMSDAELDALVNILVSRQEWPKLWNLAFELSPAWSVRIVRRFPRDWTPVAADQREVWHNLIELAERLPDQAAGVLEKQLPLAVAQARIRVSGRINDVSFSPQAPLLAVATGNRKVVFWDYQRGIIQKTITGFAHSVGRVAFLSDGSLLCGERTNSDDDCGIYFWDGEKCAQIGSHHGTVTALEPAGKRLALSAGRDQNVNLWDLSIQAKVLSVIVPQWPRQARVSPQQDRVALVDKTIRLYSLPELNELARSVMNQSGDGDSARMLRCAAFIPSEDAVVAGKQQGTVACYRPKNGRLYADRQAVFQHNATVQAIEYVPTQDLLLSADEKGQIAFTIWSKHFLAGVLTAPCERLTSLSVSDNGAFMATGDRDSTLSLWDLRFRELPGLFNQAICNYTLEQISTVFALSPGNDLSPIAQDALRFVQSVLRTRTRFDIQIDAAPVIRPGEFDILLE